MSQAAVNPKGQEEVQQGGALLGSGPEQPDDKRAGFLPRPKRPPLTSGSQAGVTLALKFNNIIVLPLNCFLPVPLIYHKRFGFSTYKKSAHFSFKINVKLKYANRFKKNTKVIIM